jgi:hypothetical protein
MEMTRRVRAPSDLTLTLRHHSASAGPLPVGAPPSPQVIVGSPRLEFAVEYSRYGAQVDPSKSVHQALVYCRYGEQPSEKLCKGKIVLLDTYGRWRVRAAKAAECGAVALILALHSSSAEDEDLHIPSKDKDGADKKKPGGSGSSAGVMDQVHDSASRLASGSGAAAAPRAARRAQRYEEAIPDDGGGGWGSWGNSNAEPAQSWGGDIAVASRTSRAGGGAGGDKKDGGAGGKKKAKKKQPTSESSEELAASKSEAFKKIPLVILSQVHSASLRALLGIRESDSPEQLYNNSLVDEMSAMGYPRSLCTRALAKCDWEIDEAVNWVDENADWLHDQSMLVADLGLEDLRDALVTGADSAGSEGLADVDVMELEASWTRFSTENPDNESMAAFASMSRRGTFVDPQWIRTISTRSTHGLVVEYAQTQRALWIHYARRSLVVLFNSWPADKPIDSFGEPRWLKQTLRVALSLDTFPAAMLRPERHLRESGSWYRAQLLQALVARSPRAAAAATGTKTTAASNPIADALLSDAAYLLGNALATRSKFDVCPRSPCLMAPEPVC